MTNMHWLGHEETAGEAVKGFNNILFIQDAYLTLDDEVAMFFILQGYKVFSLPIEHAVKHMIRYEFEIHHTKLYHARQFFKGIDEI